MPDDNVRQASPGETDMKPLRKRKRHRKYHGFLFIRNLRPGIKSKFKSTAARREDNMTDVIEALMILYCESPEFVNTILDEVKENRVKANKKR